MSISGWILLIFIIILLLLICFAIGWTYRNNDAVPDVPSNPYTKAEVWSKIVPSQDLERNTCQLFRFPDTVNSSGTFIPGAPTLDTAVLNKMQGLPLPNCIDYNNIIAQQVTHQCQAPNGAIQGSITRCYTLNGSIVGLNSVETFYSNNLCSNIPSCPGQISLINVGVIAGQSNFTGATAMCLEVDGSQAGSSLDVRAAPCDPLNRFQQFRITRSDPGVDPGPSTANTGLLARIQWISADMCLYPDTANSIGPRTTYPTLFGCTGLSDKSVVLSGLKVGTCNSGVNGFSWLIGPSFAFCDQSGGCFGCSGATGCTAGGCVALPGTSKCTGQTAGCFDSSCGGYSAMPTAAQIVFVGSSIGEGKFPPFDGRRYNGLLGPSAIMQWLIDKKRPTIYYGGGTGPSDDGVGVVFRNDADTPQIGYDISDCYQNAFTTQIINLQQFNHMINTPPCLVTTYGTEKCIPLT